jgi:hypothetical protein
VTSLGEMGLPLGLAHFDLALRAGLSPFLSALEGEA